MGKYVYWFKIRNVSHRGFGYEDTRIYYSNIEKAKRHQEQHRTTLFDSRTGKTTISKPKMYKQLTRTLRKGTHIN